MFDFSTPKPSYFHQLYYITRLKRRQWFKEIDLLQTQEKKLRELIDHAYVNVPFYHDLFNSVGVKPQDIKTRKDLQKLPILTKEIVKKNYPDKIVAKNIDIAKCYIRSTTGSTGMPLKIAFSYRMEDYAKALTFFVFSACGLRLTDKFALIYHTSGPKGFFRSFLKSLGILRWKFISIFEPIESILESLKNFKPDVISTYPSMLLLLSKKLKEQNIAGIKPHLIITGGENITEYNRNVISQTFNSDVYSFYGAEECSRLAFECKNYSGYHIISDASIIEIVKNGKNVAENEQGDIVVTSLFNYSMPLIRYKLGDIGTFSYEKCKCGRGFPLIKTIEGRSDDFLILPSGRKVSPRVINVIENIPGVSRYKTVQESRNKIIVNLVKGDGFSDKTIVDIKNHIKDGCLGEDIKVEIKLVDEISIENRGKLRAVVSHVSE